MALATLTKTGRAAIAAAITNEKLYLAWGSGNEAWDAPDAVLPSLIDATGLVPRLADVSFPALALSRQMIPAAS